MDRYIYFFTVADNPVSNDNLDGDVFTIVEGIFILSNNKNSRLGGGHEEVREEEIAKR